LTTDTFSNILYLPTDSADYLFYGTSSGELGYYSSLNHFQSIAYQKVFQEGFFSHVKRKNLAAYYKGGYLFFVYPDKNGILRFTYSSDAGSSWQSSKRLNILSGEVTSGNLYFPRVLEIGGYLYTFWWNFSSSNLSFRYNYTQLYSDSFTNETELFTAEPPLDLTGALAWNNAFCSQNNHYLFVFYKGLYLSVPQMYIARVKIDSLPQLSLKDTSKDEQDWIKDMMQKSGALSKTLEIVNDLANEALKAIKEYKNEELEKIIKDMIQREY